jgi:hypothetical protein
MGLGHVDLGKVVAGVFKGEALQSFSCSPIIRAMSTPKTPSKLSRAQLREALDTVPVSHILGKSVSRELTGKQKAFALEVAKGSTGAAAYRMAYNTKGSAKLQGSEASKLKARPSIAQEIEAYSLAIEAAKHRNPAALRELVIQSLVQVIIDPESKPGQITAAAKVLGTVTEVAAFTQRSEVKTITSSEDARAAIMAQLRQLTNAQAMDVEAVDAGADSLLAELAISEPDATHPPPTPQMEEEESRGSVHTIPLEQPPSKSFPDQDPTLHVEDDPPMPS